MYVEPPPDVRNNHAKSMMVVQKLPAALIVLDETFFL